MSIKLFPQLVAGGDTTICLGGQAQLTATGGGASYYWTAIPPDASLLIPQQQNPIVSPDTTTMYIVQSNIATGNLILNGTFELGNVGFNSEYVYNPISIVQEGTYAVVTDAHLVHPNFFCNHDHTSGSGKFMAVNGAPVPNTQVWYLDLPSIQPDQRYEFSTWITSLHVTNPALLQFSINGVLMGEPFQAYPYTCDWYQFFYIWDSDTNTHAFISIVNQNTILNGNDFALDDISFATVLVYFDTVYVEVLPQFNSTFAITGQGCLADTVQAIYEGNAPDTADFNWDFGGGTVLSGNGPGPYEIIFPSTGSYQVSLSVSGDGCGSDTTSHPVEIYDSPTVELTADATILPYLGTTTLHGTIGGSPGPLDFSWTPAVSLTDPNSLNPSTVPLEYTTTFILTVIDETSGCTGSAEITIVVAGGPLAVVATADPETICIGADVQLYAEALGGTGDYIYSWTSNPPGFTSDIPSPVVAPLVNTQYSVMVSDGLSNIEGSVEVTVNLLPVAEAGPDQTIPYGTPATLSGSGTGGNGNYSWHWEPADLLVNPDIQDPVTVFLQESTMFTLVITDLNTGCISNGDFMLVMIEGGPLGVIIQSTTPEICQGESATLMALGSGGNTVGYSYSWSDEFGGTYPPGSSIEVNPIMTTNYQVVLNDGFNTSSANFMVTVSPTPGFTLGNGQEEITACPYDTVILTPDHKVAGWSYLWSNGSINDTIIVGTTGIGFDIKSYALTVTNQEGCEFTDDITVIFDFAACFGIDEAGKNPGFRLYPNPSKGLLNLELEKNFALQSITLINSQGLQIFLKEYMSYQPLVSMNLGDLPKGLYFVRITSASRNYFRKVILE